MVQSSFDRVMLSAWVMSQRLELLSVHSAAIDILSADAWVTGAKIAVLGREWNDSNIIAHGSVLMESAIALAYPSELPGRVETLENLTRELLERLA